MEVAPHYKLLTLLTPFKMEYTVDMVNTVDMVYTVDAVDTVDTAYTVYTIETALHCYNISMYACIYC